MSEASSVRHEDRREPPLLDKRLERFVQRYVNSPVKLEIMRTVGHHPNHFYMLADLQLLVVAPLPDVERAVMELENWGLVQSRTRGDGVRVGLSRSPVVRESAVLLSRYSGRPGGREMLMRIARARR
jgi:hypothetical protein